jgi:acyl-CoA synthetase (AMP-forming)/AMP-acid ligase II
MIAWKSKLTDSAYNFSTLVELLQYRAISQPHQTAYTFLLDGETEEVSITYQQLDEQARSLAAHLQFFNASGERALLLYQPSLEYIIAFFGCLYAGVIAVPAYPPRFNKPMPRLQAIVADAQAKFALTTASILSNLERQFSQNQDLAALHWLATDTIANPIQTWQPPQIASNTLAFLQYTSGSTGNPKGVMVSHSNLLHNSALIKQCFQHDAHSQGVIWLPPYHDMGLIGGIIQPLYSGFPVVLIAPTTFLQKPFRWLQAISRYQGTTSGGPNFAYDLCIRKITPAQIESLDLSSWDVAFNGAETVRAETLEKFAATFEPCGFRREAFYPCYGMAETTLLVSGGLKTEVPIVRHVNGVALEQNRVEASSKESMRTIVSCGQVWSNQVAIVDPETLTQCPSNRIGEIWVSSLSVANGYWNNPLETEKNFHAYLGTQGPFLRTGDLGFLQDGQLFVTGRIKDVIIIRGRNYYPQDIEQTVNQSHPALQPAGSAAFATEINDEERLIVVQEIERNYLRKLDVQEVVGSIRQAVAEQHDLQVFAVVLVKPGSIPKTSSGKVQRYACRTGFLSGTLDVVDDWSEHPQVKAKYLHLNAEVESLLQQLHSSKH